MYLAPKVNLTSDYPVSFSLDAVITSVVDTVVVAVS